MPDMEIKRTCDGSEDLKFYFGATDAQVEAGQSFLRQTL